MDLHPIQGGVEILLVASCYRNRDKLRPDGPLGSYADLVDIVLGSRGLFLLFILLFSERTASHSCEIL